MPQGRAAHADVRGRWARPGGRAQGPGAGAPVPCRARGLRGEPPSGRPQALSAPPGAPRGSALGHRFSRPSPRTPYGDPGVPPPHARGPDAVGDSVPGPAPTVPSRRSLRRRTPCLPPPATPLLSGWTQISPPEASHSATRDALGQRAARKRCRPDEHRSPRPPPGAKLTRPRPPAPRRAVSQTPPSQTPGGRPPGLTPPAAPAPPARRPGRSPPARPSRAPGRWRVRGARP